MHYTHVHTKPCRCQFVLICVCVCVCACVCVRVSVSVFGQGVQQEIERIRHQNSVVEARFFFFRTFVREILLVSQ